METFGIEEADPRPGRILIVDDEATNRVLLERRLETAGYETRAVADGSQALGLMREWKPDLVLLDLMMPGLSGFDVLEERAQDPSLAGIPVVMVSALHDEASRLRGLELGAVDYINKPFSPPELQARVRNLVRMHRQQLELNRLNAELKQLTVIDSLTGVANRRSFEARWELERDRCSRYRSPLSLIVLDIDNFKGINDAYGHAAGDAVLRSVAHSLSACTRDVDLLARIGGEEFAIILAHTEAEGAHVVGERMRNAVARADLAPLKFFCTASVGVASSSGVPAAEILEAADRALYRAKARGRNRVELWRGPVLA